MFSMHKTKAVSSVFKVYDNPFLFFIFYEKVVYIKNVIQNKTKQDSNIA